MQEFAILDGDTPIKMSTRALRVRLREQGLQVAPDWFHRVSPYMLREYDIFAVVVRGEIQRDSNTKVTLSELKYDDDEDQIYRVRSVVPLSDGD